MSQTIDVSVVKNYLHAVYSDYSQKEEAEDFFKTLINSESYCSHLLEILNEIIIKDPDENMKKMSVILINQMNPELIIETIFLLNQKVDATFYETIEILTDFIASRKSNELIQLINQTLSSSDDILILKAILQLISSINFYIEKKEVEIENYENFLQMYFEYFTEIINSIMQQETIDLNHQVFIYYFMKSFSKTITYLKAIDFFYPFACFCINLKIKGNIFNKIIEMIIDTFSNVITYSDFRIFEFIEFYDDFCKSTEFIPSSSLNLWGFFLKFIPEIDFSSFDINYYISKYVFPFFKFQPQLITENAEKFIDEYDQDVFSGLNLRKFINNFVACVKFEPIYEYIFQFSNFYLNEYIEKDISEVCRILHFFSTFHQSLCDGNKANLFSFVTEKIPLLIEKIEQNNEQNSFLIIGVCLFIKRVINYSTSALLEDQGIAEMIVKFLKTTIITSFETNKNMSDLIFYFCINAIVSVSRATSIEIFNFDESESNHILSNVCRLFGEISNNTFASTFDFLMENLSKMNISVHDFVKNIWEMREENDFYLNENIFHVLTTLFINCKNDEDKQAIFMDLFTLVLKEVESENDILINHSYLNILYLFVQTFTSALLDNSEKVQFFIETVGKLIHQMLFNINEENYPSYLEDSDGFDELVSRYKYFIFEIVQFINDPTFCIDSLINPFVIPIFIKLNELSNIKEFEINFTAFNSILIKFKGNEDVFNLLFGFYNDFAVQTNLNQYSKSNFLASLIISKPSLLFQSLDNDLFFDVINESFPLLKFDVHLFALQKVLEFLSKSEKTDADIISAVAQSFYNRIEKDELIINGQFEINYQLKSASFHYNIYNEEFKNVFSTIIQILKKYGIEFQFQSNDE